MSNSCFIIKLTLMSSFRQKIIDFRCNLVDQQKYSQNLLSIIISNLYIIILCNIIDDIQTVMFSVVYRLSFHFVSIFIKNPHTRLPLNNHVPGHNFYTQEVYPLSVSYFCSKNIAWAYQGPGSVYYKRYN